MMEKNKKPTCFGNIRILDVFCDGCCDWKAECAANINKSSFADIIKEATNTRISKSEYYLNIALAVSKRSTCLKRHYGCVIVKDDVIVATGYNGSPRGKINCCDVGECKRANAERYSDYKDCPAVHAEQNALLSASHEQLKGATLYLACEQNVIDDCYTEDDNPIPCNICARMLANSGIKSVINRKGEVLWD